jgi:hypothetical protein
MNRNPDHSSMLLTAIAFIVALVWFVVTGVLACVGVWCMWRH